MCFKAGAALGAAEIMESMATGSSMEPMLGAPLAPNAEDTSAKGKGNGKCKNKGKGGDENNELGTVRTKKRDELTGCT